jgi:hypothetical protein
MNGSPQALEEACASVGLDADGARLLRLGSNAVYHLKTPVIARVSRPGTDITPVHRSVAVARWLNTADYPAVRVIDVDQRVITDGYIVTFWESVSDDGDQFATTPEIAAIISGEDAATAAVASPGLRRNTDGTLSRSADVGRRRASSTPVISCHITGRLARPASDPPEACCFCGQTRTPSQQREPRCHPAGSRGRGRSPRRE